MRVVVVDVTAVVKVVVVVQSEEAVAGGEREVGLNMMMIFFLF